MLMRWAMGSVCLRGLDDLSKHAAGKRRMQEGHARCPDAGTRLLVDHPQARLLQARQRGVDVGHLVGDVVQPRAALGQEAADRRVVAERALRVARREL